MLTQSFDKLFDSAKLGQKSQKNDLSQDSPGLTENQNGYLKISKTKLKENYILTQNNSTEVNGSSCQAPDDKFLPLEHKNGHTGPD